MYELSVKQSNKNPKKVIIFLFHHFHIAVTYKNKHSKKQNKKCKKKEHSKNIVYDLIYLMTLCTIMNLHSSPLS